MLHWFASEAAAAVLDRGRVAWRHFLVGEQPALPAQVRDLLAVRQR